MSGNRFHRQSQGHVFLQQVRQLMPMIPPAQPRKGGERWREPSHLIPPCLIGLTQVTGLTASMGVPMATLLVPHNLAMPADPMQIRRIS